MIFPRELHRFYKNPLKLPLKESNYLCIITFTDRLVKTHPFSYNPLCRYWFDQQIVLSIRFQIYNPASQAMNDIATKRSYFNTTLVIYIENNINMGRQLITHNFITGTADKKDPKPQKWPTLLVDFGQVPSRAVFLTEWWTAIQILSECCISILWNFQYIRR